MKRKLYYFEYNYKKLVTGGGIHHYTTIPVSSLQNSFLKNKNELIYNEDYFDFFGEELDELKKLYPFVRAPHIRAFSRQGYIKLLSGLKKSKYEYFASEGIKEIDKKVFNIADVPSIAPITEKIFEKSYDRIADNFFEFLYDNMDDIKIWYEWNRKSFEELK